MDGSSNSLSWQACIEGRGAVERVIDGRLLMILVILEWKKFENE